MVRRRYLGSMLLGLLLYPVSGAWAQSIDVNGDPLPPAALARLGSMRLRHGHPVESVEFAGPGQLLVTKDKAGTYFWEAATGRLIQRFPLANCPLQPNYHRAYAPDGRAFAAADSAGLVRVWDVASGQEKSWSPLFKQTREFDEDIFSGCGAFFSGDGKIVGWFGFEKKVRVVRLGTPTPERSCERGSGSNRILLKPICRQRAKSCTLFTTSAPAQCSGTQPPVISCLHPEAGGGTISRSTTRAWCRLRWVRTRR